MKTRTFNTTSNDEDAATTPATGSCGADVSSTASARRLGNSGLGISGLGIRALRVALSALGIALSVVTRRRTITAAR